MPVSKRPRKKGKHGAKIAIAKRLVIKNGRVLSDSAKAMDDFQRMIDKEDLARSRYIYMSLIADKSNMYRPFIEAYQLIDDLPNANDFMPFNLLASHLTQGAMIHKCLEVQEKEWLKEIQHAAFMIFTVYKQWLLDEKIPEANLEPLRVGIDAVRALVEYAWDNNPQELREIKIRTTRTYIELHPEETEARERLLLGDRWAQTRSWNLQKLAEEKNARLAKQKRTC